MRIAVFPGSFDPVTIGHEAIIRRALPLFDKIIVAVGQNTIKKNMFSLEQRMQWLSEALNDQSATVEIAAYSGLTMDFCKKKGAQFILRGLRTTTDFEYEFSISQVNRQISGIETIFMLTDPKYMHITSSIVRDLFLYGGDFYSLIPNGITLKKED